MASAASAVQHAPIHGLQRTSILRDVESHHSLLAASFKIARFGLSWLAFVLYIDAIISPAGTGLLAIGFTARYNFALARNGCILASLGT